jgi:hypothetical protein
MIGMIHLPGINDIAYAKWIASQIPAQANNLWYQLP